MERDEAIILGLFCILAVLLTAMPALGQDFYANSDTAVIKACACSTATDTITITNKDGRASTIVVYDDSTATISESSVDLFTLSPSGEAAKWITYSPSASIIESGQSRQFTTYVTPSCSAAGDYSLDTLITTDKGAKKVLHQTVSVGICQNLEVRPVRTSRLVCPCSPAVFEVNIRNPGNYAEFYSLEVDNLESATSFSENNFILPAGESKRVFVYINADCSVHGDYDITLSASTKKSGLQAEVPLSLGIGLCYDYDVVTGGSYRPPSAVTNVSNETEQSEIPPFTPYSDTYSVCENEQRIIPVHIKNTAEINNRYRYHIKAEDWVSYDSVDYANIPAGQTASFNIYLNPPRGLEGDFNLTLRSVTERGDLEQVRNIPVRVKNCFRPDLTLPKKIKVDYNTQSHVVNVTNTGSRTGRYMLALEDAPGWISLSTSGGSIKSGRTETFSIITAPSELDESGTYKATLKLISTKNYAVYDFPLVVKLKSPGIVSKTIDAFVAYRWYVMGGLVALIAVIILLSFVKKHRAKSVDKEFHEKYDTAKKVPAKKTAAKKVPAKDVKAAKAPKDRNLKPWLIGGVVLLALILAGIAAYYVYPSDTDINETGESVESILTANATFNDTYVENETIASILASNVTFNDTVADNGSIEVGDIKQPPSPEISAKESPWLGYLVPAVVGLALLLLIWKLAGIKKVKKAKGEIKIPWNVIGAVVLIILVVGGLVFAFQYLKESTPAPVNETAPLIEITNFTVIEAPIQPSPYTEDEILSAIPNGSYGYDSSGNVVNADTGEVLFPSEVAQLLSDNLYEISNKTDFSTNDIAALILVIEKRSYILEANVTQTNISQEPACSKTINRSLSINLSLIFSDPDGDKLIFTSTQPDNMTVDIDGEIVTLTPDPGLSGRSTVSFTADDGKGGIIQSGELTLCIEETQEESTPPPSFFKKYYLYLIIAAAFILLLVLIIIYHEPILEFLEEDDGGKK